MVFSKELVSKSQVYLHVGLQSSEESFVCRYKWLSCSSPTVSLDRNGCHAALQQCVSRQARLPRSAPTVRLSTGMVVMQGFNNVSLNTAVSSTTYHQTHECLPYCTMKKKRLTQNM
jgi:hypothetical protein